MSIFTVSMASSPFMASSPWENLDSSFVVVSSEEHSVEGENLIEAGVFLNNGGIWKDEFQIPNQQNQPDNAGTVAEPVILDYRIKVRARDIATVGMVAPVAVRITLMPVEGCVAPDGDSVIIPLHGDSPCEVKFPLQVSPGRWNFSWKVTPLYGSAASSEHTLGADVFLFAGALVESASIRQVPFGPESARLMGSALVASPYPAKRVRSSGISGEEGATEGDGVFTVTGQLTYWDDRESRSNPISGVTVKLLDSDMGSAEDVMGSYVTGSDGYFSFASIPLSDPDDMQAGPPDIFVRASFGRSEFRVTDASGVTYEINSQISWDISSGQYTINLELGAADSSRGLGSVFRAILDGVNYSRDRMSAARNSIQVIWPSTEATNYVYGYQLPSGTVVSEKINIAASAQWSRASILHEYGHAVMMGLYGYNFSNWPNMTGGNDPSPHYVNSVSNGPFALREGFAEFFSCLVDNTALSLTQYSNTTTPNAESNDWWKGRDATNTDGSIVEGSVASALWDMVDTSASVDNISGDDDSMSCDPVLIANVLRSRMPSDIGAFWQGWIASSYPSIAEVASIFSVHHIDAPLPANNKPTVMVTSPSTMGVVATGSFTVTWNSYDADGDTLLADISYDTDTNSDNGMVEVARGLENTGSWSWNLSGVPSGTYRIHVMVRDSKGGSGGDYSDGTLLANYNGNPPVIDPLVPLQSAMAGRPIRIDLSPYERDTEDGVNSAALTWTATGLASDVTLQGQGSVDDVLTFTPSTSFVGIRRCTLVLTDSGGRVATQYLDLLWLGGTDSAVTVSSASSSPPPVSGYGAEKLHDGLSSYQGDFATRVTATEAIITIDLGSDRIISTLDITSDGEYGASGVAVSMASSSDSSTFTGDQSFGDLIRTAGAPSVTRLTMTPFLFGRYMQLRFTGFHESGWFQLNEIAPRGWDVSNSGLMEIVSIISLPLAFSGSGPEKLHDGVMTSNGDYAVSHSGATVELTVDLGQDRTVHGFETVNDGEYGATGFRVYGVTSETRVILGMYEGLAATAGTPTPFRAYVNPATFRTLVFEYTGFHHSTYLQLNELKILGVGGTSSEEVPIQPINMLSSISPFPGYGTDQLVDGLKVHNGDFAVRKRSGELVLTFDFGADKTIRTIRHYNDGQYGAKAVNIEFATAAASTSFTSAGSFTDLNVGAGTPNLDTFTLSAATGRYFRFRYQTGNDPLWLQLNEISFYGASGQGSGADGLIRPVSALSQPAGITGYSASRIIDGIRVFNGDFAVKNQGAQVAITLDLGSDQDFSTLRVYNDGLYGARSLQVFTALSATSGTFVDRGTFTGLSGIDGAPGVNDISIPGSRGRYVKVQVLTFFHSSWFQLNEIEVHAQALTATKYTPVGAVSNISAWPGYGLETLYNGIRTFNGDFACNNLGARTTITFDLGADRSVGSMIHVNDGQFGAPAVSVKYAREASPDIFISLGSFSDLFTTQGSPNENIIDLPDFTGRFVRLEYSSFADSAWFQLNEVEFHVPAQSSSGVQLLESAGQRPCANGCAVASQGFETASVAILFQGQAGNVLTSSAYSPASGLSEAQLIFSLQDIAVQHISPELYSLMRGRAMRLIQGLESEHISDPSDYEMLTDIDAGMACEISMGFVNPESLSRYFGSPVQTLLVLAPEAENSAEEFLFTAEQKNLLGLIRSMGTGIVLSDLPGGSVADEEKFSDTFISEHFRFLPPIGIDESSGDHGICRVDEFIASVAGPGARIFRSLEQGDSSWHSSCLLNEFEVMGLSGSHDIFQEAAYPESLESLETFEDLLKNLAGLSDGTFMKTGNKQSLSMLQSLLPFLGEILFMNIDTTGSCSELNASRGQFLFRLRASRSLAALMSSLERER
jgi:hypothetical protein